MPNFPVKFIGADSTITTMSAAVQGAIEHFCNRQLDSQNYISTLNGSGLSKLFLPQWPITAVSLVQSRTFAGSTEYDDTITDYEIDTDYEQYLWRLNRWPTGRRNLQVSYTAGYTSGTMPVELTNVAAQMVMDTLMKVPHDVSIEEERLGHYLIKYLPKPNSIDQEYQNVLIGHRRMLI
jgi:uncharacterized protein (DUF885 family)